MNILSTEYAFDFPCYTVVSVVHLAQFLLLPITLLLLHVRFVPWRRAGMYLRMFGYDLLNNIAFEIIMAIEVKAPNLI
jgi:hypothetical protein